MAVGVVVGDGGDGPRRPFKRQGRVVARARNEGVAVLQVAEVARVPGDGVEQIAERGVVQTVANDHEPEDADGVVDEVGGDPAPQIEVAEVLIGQGNVRPQAAVKMDHAVEIGLAARTGQAPEIEGARPRSPGRAFVQFVEIGCDE